MTDQVSQPATSQVLFADDEYKELCASVSESLASLSERCEPPTGYDLIGEEFTADEVDFTGSGWLHRVIDVQTWLHLDDSIARSEIDDDPLAGATRLFALMGNGDPRSCVTSEHGIVMLTYEGADALNSRLDAAAKLRDQFLEMREETNKKSATKQWHDLWEEEEQAGSPAEPIRAKTGEKQIRDFSGWAEQGRLKLNPTYQRGDVWPTSDAQKLIESVLRGIPLPSVILLRPSTANGEYEVVDGKQRLTALLRFVGQHPSALERVDQAHRSKPGLNLKEHFHKDYRKFKRLWKSEFGEALTAKRERELYFPFALPKRSPVLHGDLACFAGKYYYEILDAEITLAEVSETAKTLFSGPSEYKVPIIEYIDATTRQIHDVFHLYNKQGKHLNAEEIRNAVFHEVDLARLLLVAAGDNDNVEALVPFVEEHDRSMLHDVGEALSDYRFGTLRYKRTKVLGWIVSALLRPSLDDEGKLQIRSTARHINMLLEAIRDDPAHQLRSHAALNALVQALHDAIIAHSESDDVWHPTFKDSGKGVKWQELQLVASLLGVLLLWAGGLDLETTLDTHADALLQFTKNSPRPEKAQNKTQWAYLGHISLGILAACGGTEEDASQKLNDVFGISCVNTLRAAKALHKLER